MASRDWWDTNPHEVKGVDPSKLTMSALLEHWNAIETDFHSFYGCDLADGVLYRRPFRWFRVRLVRLLSEDTALSRAVGLRDRQREDDTMGSEAPPPA